MPTEAFASPLIVWFGHDRYTFPVGRDVTIGRDGRADIRVDGVGAPTHVVVHHNGRQWIAVDRGEGGIYVDGVRMSTVFIHDGRAITLGDPQHGPRLVFQLGPPPPPPPPPPRRAPRPEMRPVPPGRPGWPSPAPPPPRPERPKQPPVARPPVMPTPPPQIRWSPQPPPIRRPQRPPKRNGFIEALTGAMHKLRPQRREPRPHEAVPTTAFRQQDAPDTKAPERPPAPPPPVMPPPTVTMPPEPQRLTPPTRSEQLAAPVPGPPSTQPPPAPRKRIGFVDALTGAMHKLRPQRPPATKTPQPAPQPTVKTGPLEARQVRLSVDGEQVLAELSFTAEPQTLTAVIGHSAASTAAVVDVLGGAVQPSVGTVHFDGHDVTADQLRPHIGVVPRYDLLHPALTVEQALGYAAELRLPPGTSADHRRQSVLRAVSEMKLDLLRTVQVGNLTAEQRKLTSMAMELLTEPSLLVLDEPTAGVDAAADGEIRATLRRLADEGRVVVVAITPPADVDICDQVVLLTGTGTPAFAGPPAEIATELGTTDWPEIITRVRTDPYGAHDAYLARQPESPSRAESIPAQPPNPRAHLSLWRQIVVAARRQAWLMVGDQRYFILLTILAVLFSAISLLVPGHSGLGPANPYGSSPDEAVEILAVLTMGAVVMGTALGIRDIFGERRIFRREQANGLSASAFVAGKVIVYSFVAIIAAAIMTTAAVVGKGAPTQGAVLFGDTTFAAALELFVVLAITTVVSAMVALAFSSLANYVEQILLIAVLIVLISAVFAGAIFPIAGRFGLGQISWLVPSRWGFAALASTVDVGEVNLLATADESWKHSSGEWVFDVAMLVGLGVLATGWVRWRLRRPAQRSVQPKVTVAENDSRT